MTRHGGLHNTYCTCYHSIGTCDMVQEDVSSRAGFIIGYIAYSNGLFPLFYYDYFHLKLFTQEYQCHGMEY